MTTTTDASASPPPPPPSVIIVGAGPVGAATAYGLRTLGFDVLLCDRAAGATDTEGNDNGATTTTGVAAVQGAGFAESEKDAPGGGISMYGNGFTALRGLGLYDKVTSRPHHAIRDVYFMKMDGTDGIQHFVAATEGAERSQFLRYHVHRPLLDACLAVGVRIETGKKVVAIDIADDDNDQNDKAVTVRFADGSTASAACVVGADGMHSAVRRLAFPQSFPHPRVWAVGYIGVFPLGETDLAHDLGLYSDAVSGNFVFTNRCAPTLGSFIVSEFGKIGASEPAAAAGSASDLLDDGNSWRPYTDLPANAARLAEKVAAWGAPPPVADAVRNASRLTPITIYDLPPLPTLHDARGRVVLLGDAAHGTVPTTGQGLNLGLEDAATLVDLFREFPRAAADRDARAAVFKMYEDARMPRVRSVCKAARDVANSLKAGSWIEAAFGRFMMRVVFSVFSYFGVTDDTVGYDYRSDVKRVVDKHRSGLAK
ncbi:hypothetical protein DFJ73DRAFT_801337 [Zopfochytrium polystomum]|nr:hypothetical protein DFJ73DRAFT_801337 [Zopfochytrium polystomum]